MTIHKNLSDAELHEPKGAATAASGTVYISDGAGSGTWIKLPLSSLDLTSTQNPNTVYVSAVLTDVSTASSILVPAPENCTFVSARFYLGGAITVADSILTLTRNDGSSFGSTVTITQAASAEGTSFSFTASLNQTITSPGYVKIATDGGSTTTQPLYCLLKFTRIP